MTIVNVSATNDIKELWWERAQFYSSEHRIMDNLVNAYYGTLPSDFDDFFEPEMHVHIINMIRMAWDDLANRAGKLFRHYVEPDNDTPTARARAEKLEAIGAGYNFAGRAAGGISRDLLQKVIAWWLVGCGNAVYLVQPDYETKTPFFTFRDPRTYYPPLGWTPYTQAAPDDGLFAYQLPVGELKARYPDRAGEISQALSRTKSGAFGPRPLSDDAHLVWVGEYYRDETWQVCTLTDNVVTLARADQGDRNFPGINPVVPLGLYTPGSAKGRSLFNDQISIQAAMARMFSQKLDFYDRTLYPLVFHTRLLGETLRVGPYSTNEWDASDGVPPKVDVIAPAHQIDADQTMAFAMGLSRMLNRNPEQFQGQGSADSAKALQELNSGITSTIRDGFWPPMLEAEPRLYEIAATMDVNLWGNVRKSATGRLRNKAVKTSYVPGVDLRDRENTFCVEPGSGVAGYQGTLELLQLVGAKQLSELTALEQRDDIPDADREYRRIEADRFRELIRMELAAKAQASATQPGMPGTLKEGALAQFLKMIESGKSLEEAYDSLVGQIEVPQPMAPPGMPGAGGPGGAPGQPTPGAPGTGNAAPFLPLPTLEALRGGPGSV